MSERTISLTSLRRPLHDDIDERLIEAVVRRFYGKVRADPDLGPIFAAAVGDDWEPHLRKMFDFWSSVTRMTGRYKGKPVPVHMALGGLRPAHFQVWLSLFRETAEEICSAPVAAIFVEKSEKIAESLQLALFFRAEDLARPSARGERP